jgi:hypothetical protein
MVDDSDDVILGETRTDLTFDSQVGREKFAVTYGVENCEGSVAPSRNSTGVVRFTATTEDGELLSSGTLECII